MATYCVNDLWNVLVLQTAEVEDISTQPAPKRRRKLSSHLADCVVEYAQEAEDSQERSRTHIMYPILDRIEAELTRRFHGKNEQLLLGISALDPRSEKFMDAQAITGMAKAYKCNVEDLTCEMHQFKRLLQRKFPDGSKLAGPLHLCQFLEPYKDAFYELFKLVITAVVLPVSSAACERSFSSMKLIKTYLRTTMADQRLSDLTVLAVESERAKRLDIDNIVKLFAALHKNRRVQLK
jgi:hypothetical protein